MGRGARGIANAVEQPKLLPNGLHVRPSAVRQLGGQRVSQLKQFSGAHRERLYWGTYRPMAYLGIRARTPESVIAGLMWNSVKDGKDVLRHYCEDTDNLTRWSWLRHDGSTYGRQELVDHGLVVTTYFLKSSEVGSGYGGDWVVRVKVEELEPQKLETRKQSVFFYVAEEGGQTVHLHPEHGESAPFASGSANEIGGWELHVKYKEAISANYEGLRELHMSKLADDVHNTLEAQKNSTGRFQLSDKRVEESNVAIIQLAGVVPFEADMVFISGVNNEQAHVQSRVENLTGPSLDKRLAKSEMAFDERFQKTFNLQEKVDGEKELETARVALSNMLGGMGYFYGQTRVAIPPESRRSHSFDDQDYVSKDGDHWLYWPSSLYTGVPSRSIFPRGFLWDEGFHQLLINRWDRTMSLEVIANWFDLVNVDGWIPRELILGEEALSKIPPLYVNQHTDNANPPAFLLVLRDLALKFREDQKRGKTTPEDTEFFTAIFPKVVVWFDWFSATQTGKEPGSYYWHGRDTYKFEELNPKTLTSGLDDYPRASHPTDDERHVDLHCWIANSADTMALLAQIVGKPSERFEKIARNLSDLELLNKLHYDHETGHYYDYGYHTEKVELRWTNEDNEITGHPTRVLKRVVLEPPTLGWVPHFGLNSLFPFVMRLLPADSPILDQHLDMLQNPDLLWTDFGLRSLATTSSIYMKYNSEFEAPYWRGPVWININYLVLSALHGYAQDGGPFSKKAAALYGTFRKNLIKNIVQRYHETGYIWENYDNAMGGKGQGAHPFTGWSALIVLIMGEMY